jgi:tetratricopeptide (TPR) repeat protein/CHAT domain-containing protein
LNNYRFRTKYLLLLLVMSAVSHCLSAPSFSANAAPPIQEGDAQAQAYELIKEGAGLYNQSDLPGAVEKFQTALTLFREVGDQAGEATALGDIGAVYVAMGQSQNALTYLEQALTIQRQIGDRAGEGTTLGTLGTVYYNLAQYDQAVDYYQEALAIIEAEGNRVKEATLLAALGTVYSTTGQPQQALDYYKQALTIQARVGDQYSEANTLSQIGSVYLDTGQLHQASAYFDQALTIQRQIGDRAGEAFTLSKIGEFYAEMEQPQRALSYYQQALTIQRQVGGQVGEAAILIKIGAAHEDAGQLQQAQTYFKQALTLQRQIDDRAGEWETLAKLGAVYHNLEQYQQALDYYQQALAIARTIGVDDQAGEERVLNSIGAVYVALGQPEQALGYYQQALAIQQQIGDRLGEVTTLNNLGVAYHILGNYSQALEHLQQALLARKEVGGRDGEATTLVNIGTVYFELGRPQEALVHFQQALPIFREVGDRSGEANTLGHIGGAYQDILGQFPRALDYYQQALKIYQEVGARQGEAQQLNNIGYIHDDLGQPEQALEYYKQALTIFREVGDSWGEAITLDNIGGTYDRLGQPQQAMTHYQDALSLRQAIGNRAGEAKTLNNIGTLQIGLHQPKQALTYFQQALPIAQAIGDRSGEAITLDNIGIAYLYLGHQAEALAHFRQAVEIIESIRSGMSIEELKSGFASQHAGPYQSIVSLLLEMDRLEEAFAYAERARARAFLDQLANVRIDPRQGADPALIQDEQRLVGEIADFERRMRELTSQPANPQTSDLIGNLQARLTAKRAEYADLLIQLKLSNPAYGDLISVDPLSLEQIQADVLDENTVLVSYFVTDEKTIAFIISRGNFAAVSIAITRQDLADRVATFRSLISLEVESPADRLAQDRITASQALHDILLSPLASYLTAAFGEPDAPRSHLPSLIIVPHDVLHYLPFAALLDGEGVPLSTRFTLSLAPSASALSYARGNQNPDDGRLLALGDPATHLSPLPYAEREVEAISRLYPLRTTFVGPAATEAAFRAKMSGADWVHLAAHAELSPTSPLFSALYLAEEPVVESQRSLESNQDAEGRPVTSNSDGRLEVREVFNLDLTGANGVILSACETGLGEQSRGDEMVGLTRAFLYAGTPVVVASLWEVEDEATATLMTAFHQGLRAGLGPAAALRAAQEKVRGIPRWTAPYYWAGFQVVGDGGPGGELVSHEMTPAETTVLGATPTPSSPDEGGLAQLRTGIAGLLALLGIVGWVTWRRRGRRSG